MTFKSKLVTGALAWGVAVSAAIAFAADPWADYPRPAGDYVGTLTCVSTSCHGRTAPQHGGRVGHEYALWLGAEAIYSGSRRHYDYHARLESSGGDPHAMAGQRILEPRFQEVLRRASQRPDGSTDQHVD